MNKIVEFVTGRRRQLLVVAWKRQNVNNLFDIMCLCSFFFHVG